MSDLHPQPLHICMAQSSATHGFHPSDCLMMFAGRSPLVCSYSMSTVAAPFHACPVNFIPPEEIPSAKQLSFPGLTETG